MTLHFEPWQWALAVVAALLVGVSKTGIAGLGMLFVAIFTSLLPDAKQATGVVLPLLIAGDAVAVLLYRRHMRWRFFRKLFPWAALGVVAGYFALGRVSDHQAKVMIGAIIVTLVGVHLWRRRRAAIPATAREAEKADETRSEGAAPREEPSFEADHGRWFSPVIGLLVGFTTLVANAAGPLATVYFLAARLPKMEFVGTGAVFFMILNWYKVPFMAGLGLLNGPSLWFNLLLVPAVLVGAVVGRWVLPKIDQALFENLALLLSAAAGLKLLFWP